MSDECVGWDRVYPQVLGEWWTTREWEWWWGDCSSSGRTGGEAKLVLQSIGMGQTDTFSCGVNYIQWGGGGQLSLCTPVQGLFQQLFVGGFCCIFVDYEPFWEQGAIYLFCCKPFVTLVLIGKYTNIPHHLLWDFCSEVWTYLLPELELDQHFLIRGGVLPKHEWRPGGERIEES